MSIYSFKYFLLVIDDTTYIMYIKLIKDKSAIIAIPTFNLIIKRLELELGEKVILV